MYSPSSTTVIPSNLPSDSPPVLLPTPPHPKPALALTQIILATLIGLVSLIAFTILRRSMPRLYGGKGKKYTTRHKRNKNITRDSDTLPTIPNGIFSWIGPTLSVSEDHIIKEAGMDSFIILSFFKMCLKTVLGFVGLYILVIIPIRWHQRQQDEHDSQISENTILLCSFVGLSYAFTALALYWLNTTTRKIIKTRQSQSDTDSVSEQSPIISRTVMISGIPPELREAKVLKEMLEGMLGQGTIGHIAVCREWKRLNVLWGRRENVIRKLERLWTKYLGKSSSNNVQSHFGTRVSEDIAIGQRFRDEEEGEIQEETGESGSLSSYTGSLINAPLFNVGSDHEEETSLIRPAASRPMIRTGFFFGLLGTPIDAISHYTTHLQILNQSLTEARKHHYPTTSTAFVTFNSELTAQICSQTILDSHGDCLRVKMAPEIGDVNWDNIVLSRNERRWYAYLIGVVIVVVSIGLVYPVSYVAGLLNITSIKRHFPLLGGYLEHHEWAKGLVTVVLPTYLFTLMNVIIPYAYDWLCSRQRFVSREEQTISAIRMNFFYIFVNLFLVFTVVGVRGNYRDFIQDGTKFATQLSLSLNSLSLFYTDLLILQGIGLFPFKLLILGSLLQFTYHRHTSFTARDLSKLYIAPKFTISQHLPQPMLIFTITLIYAAQSLAILLAAIVYFSMGYMVYKYQLCYCYAPLISTRGKLWPLIYRRVIFGLLLAQFVMIGTVVGVNSKTKGYAAMFAIILLAAITVSWWLICFEKRQRLLCSVVALRGLADHTEMNGIDNAPARPNSFQQQDLLEDWGSVFPLFGQSQLPDPSSTKHTNNNPKDDDNLRDSYAYPYLTVPLDGPWIQLEKQRTLHGGNTDDIIVVMVNDTGENIIRKFLYDVI